MYGPEWCWTAGNATRAEFLGTGGDSNQGAEGTLDELLCASVTAVAYQVAELGHETTFVLISSAMVRSPGEQRESW